MPSLSLLLPLFFPLLPCLSLTPSLSSFLLPPFLHLTHYFSYPLSFSSLSFFILSPSSPFATPFVPTSYSLVLFSSLPLPFLKLLSLPLPSCFSFSPSPLHFPSSIPHHICFPLPPPLLPIASPFLPISLFTTSSVLPFPLTMFLIPFFLSRPKNPSLTLPYPFPLLLLPLPFLFISYHSHPSWPSLFISFSSALHTFSFLIPSFYLFHFFLLPFYHPLYPFHSFHI